MKGLPENALRVGDSVFVGTHITASCLFLGFDKLFRGVQASFDHLQFLIIFRLNTEVIEAGVGAAIRNLKVIPLIVQHPFRIIIMLYGRIASEQHAV